MERERDILTLITKNLTKFQQKFDNAPTEVLGLAPTVVLGRHRQWGSVSTDRGACGSANRGARGSADRGAHVSADRNRRSLSSYKITDYKKPNKMFNRNLTMGQQRCSGWRRQWGSVGADSGAWSAPTVGLGQHRQRGLWQRRQRGSCQRQQKSLMSIFKQNHWLQKNLTKFSTEIWQWANRGAWVGADSGVRSAPTEGLVAAPAEGLGSAPTVGNSKCSIHNLNPSHFFGNHEKTTKILQKKCKRIFKKPDVYFNAKSFSSNGWRAAPAEAPTRLLVFRRG